MKQTKLILVGGFLGAGKTTLLGQAAKVFIKQGKRVGLITNDQAENLVDTAILEQVGLSVAEIAGGCFCCRFTDLVDASDRLVESSSADVLIGEPVGSCTDLSATVLQPIKEFYGERYLLAPFTVLVDPIRLNEILDPRAKSTLHPSARYILRKQLEEADIIAINKIDLLSVVELAELQARTSEVFPNTPQVCLSGLTGDGVADWLELLDQNEPVGRRIVDVDYDIYAEGEAVLGWLNATVALTSDQSVDWNAFCVDLLQTLRSELKKQSAEIAHVKVFLEADGGEISANLTRNDDTIVPRGSVNESAREASLILNARVEMSPEALSAVVENVLATVSGISSEIRELRCLSPGRPEPIHRYTEVVAY